MATQIREDVDIIDFTLEYDGDTDVVLCLNRQRRIFPGGFLIERNQKFILVQSHLLGRYYVVAKDHLSTGLECSARDPQVATLCIKKARRLLADLASDREVA